MAEPIGALRAELSANAAAFHSDMMAARNSVRTAASSMKASFTSIRTAGANAYKSLFSIRTAVAGFTGGAFVGALKKFAGMADEIKSQSSALGVTAEQYQELMYVATQMGATQEGAAKSFTIFTRVLGDATNGSKSAQQAIANLGFTVDDIRGKNPMDLFTMFADRLRSIEDPAKRAAVAADLFGRGWADLTPVIMEGGAAIDALREKARQMGLIVSNEMIEKAAAANDEFDTLGQIMKVSGMNMAAEFLPAIRTIAQIMTSPGFQEGVTSFASNTKDVIEYIANNIETLKTWAAVMAGAYAGAKAGRFLGAYGAVAGAGAGAILGVAGTMDQKKSPLQGIYDQMEKDKNAAFGSFDISSAITRPPPGGGGDWSAFDAGASDPKKWEQHLQSIRDRIAAMQDEARTYGMSTYEIERNKMALELRQQAVQQGISLDATTISNIDHLSDLYAQQVTTLEKVRLAHERQQAAAQQSYDIIKTGFTDWIKGGREFSEVLVDIASKFADMALEAAFANLFAPAAGGAAGGTFGAIFSGIGKLFGFATGGSFRVGGSGGPDSKTVAFRASPGEIVDVRKPGQDGGSGVNIQQSFQFNNVDPTMRPWVQQQLERVRSETIAASTTAVRVGRSNDPNFFPVG